MMVIWLKKPNRISQEMRHAKILSHDLQRSLRRRKEEDALLQVLKKADNDKILNLILHNKNDKEMKELIPQEEDRTIKNRTNFK